jgi:phage tail tape-measure protein
MANTSIEIEIKALDKASGAFDKIERSLGPINRKVGKLDGQFDKVDKSIKRSSGSFGKFKGLLAGAITVGGLTAFTKSVVEASSRAEDLKTTLETVTGSAQAGDDAFKFINDFATRTPFDIETLTETFIKLQAAGITPTEDLLTKFGDMASVTTDRVGSLNAITDLFARTTAGGLGLEDLNRLADRGIPVFKIFEEKLGLTRLEVSEFGKTAEGAAKLKDALLEGLDENFGGGMEKASQNLSVSLSNMGIAANNALIAVGEGGLSDAINRATGKFTEFITNNEDLAIALGEKLGQAVTFVTDGIIMLFENADKAKPIFDLLGVVFKDIVAPAAVLIFDALVKLSEILKPMIEATLPVAKTIFEGLGAVMTDVVVPAFNTIIDTITKVIEKIQGMIDFIGAGINKVKEFGGAVGDKVSGGFTKAGDAIGGWVEGGKENIMGFYDWAVGNSVIPDLVNDIGKYMDMMPKKMVDPIAKAVAESKHTMNKLPTAINPNVISSPVSGVGSGMSGMSSGLGNANSTMNFNITGVDAGGAGQFQQKQMQDYIKGVATQVAYSVLRQNTGFGGLV